MKMNGTELLVAFKNGSEDSYTELVRRYAGLVFSAAKRRLTSAHLAEEAAQSVFTRLAKSAPRFSNDAELAAWLHRTTLNVAVDVWRSETRRVNREQLAVSMQTDATDKNSLWEELAPQLDEALNQLASTDRHAILLRFFEHRSMADVGRALAMSEDAAKMRIHRAVNRLREQLESRGVTCTASILTGLLVERTVDAVPAHLFTKLSSAQSLVAAGTAGSLFTSIAIIMSKTKIAATVGALAVIIVGLMVVNRTEEPASNPTTNQKGTNNKAFAELKSKLPSPEAISKKSSLSGESIQKSSLLEDAKNELRSLLYAPTNSNIHPPPALTSVLRKFGRNVSEAIPILLESAKKDDHESRAWGISGLGFALHRLRNANQHEQADQAFALARPILSQYVISPEEPDGLRMSSISIYMQETVDSNGNRSLLPEAREDLLTALKTGDADKKAFRLTIADMLSGYFQGNPEGALQFASELKPLLTNEKSSERLLAAYALASWPGEKPPEVKDILLAELKARTDRSYRAAQALGKLGLDALDTVPELIRFAQASGPSESGMDLQAMEAAFLIQPELRAQYPEISAKLKQQDAAHDLPAPNTIAEALNNPEHRQRLVTSLQAEIKSRPYMHETILLKLEKEAASAPSSQQAGLQSIIDQLRQMEIPPYKLPVANLVSDAWVLLTESKNANGKKLGEILDTFATHSRDDVTQENFQHISDAIKTIDPQFHTAWRKTVLQNYPHLDRIAPAATTGTNAR